MSTPVKQWAAIAFSLARDLGRIKRVCNQEHPPKMGSPTKDWPAGTETRHRDGSWCVLLEDGDFAIVIAPPHPSSPAPEAVRQAIADRPRAWPSKATTSEETQ